MKSASALLDGIFSGPGRQESVRRRLRAEAAAPHYIVLNADEGEPGTFKDRELLLRRPDRVLEGLARQAGLNEQKLKKGFKLLYDTTINKYLLNEKMEQAKVLLAEGSKSIKEIAASTGFSNHGYFAGKFKEKFGILPSDYLKAVRQDKIPPKVEKAVA